DAQVRRRRTLDAIKRIVLRESLNQPLIVMFEDLHWVDEEAQALLNLLADSIGNQQSLDLGELPARVPRRVGKQNLLHQLRLDPLGRESAAEMLNALLGADKDLVALKRSSATVKCRGWRRPNVIAIAVLVLWKEKWSKRAERPSLRR